VNRQDMRLPQRVLALFPASAYRIVIVNAWRPAEGMTEPGPGAWNPGWQSVQAQPPTRAVLNRLAEQGFTWVNLQASGCANPFRDAAIASLV
jgi:hypothetical protein